MNVSTQTSNRAWVEVDLEGLVANAASVQRAVSGARLLPMVKADAYGVGVQRVVRALEPLDPWGYGVATVAEGAELRRAGIDRPIVVFTPASGNDRARYEVDDLRAVLDDADVAGTWGMPYHLEIDTGMGRAGIRWDDVEAISRALESKPEGVFTHFHSADENDSTVREQLRRFRGALSNSKQRPSLVHVANSAGAFRGVGEFDLIRPGIFLYGGGIGRDLPAPQPVVRLKAQVVSAREVQPGDTVSYGAEWRAATRTTVATLGVGYADGVRRSIQGSGSVLLRGVRCPVVGRVTMDMTMVDVGPEGGVFRGDVATLIGSDGSDCITLDEFAGWAGTISYEVLVGLGKRLPRVYLEREDA